MTIPIPPDEALIRAAEAHIENIYSLRAVATLAAKQAAEQAVKEAVLRIDQKLDDYGEQPTGWYRSFIRGEWSFAFTPTPPKEQQPVTDAHACDCGKIEHGRHHHACPTQQPTPDPATVRLCIERLKAEGYDDEAATRCLESLLPKPTHAPEPERYVTLREFNRMAAHENPSAPAKSREAFTLPELAARHGWLTPEKAYKAIHPWFIGDANVHLAASIENALHRAAKGGESK